MSDEVKAHLEAAYDNKPAERRSPSFIQRAHLYRWDDRPTVRRLK